MKLEIGQIWVSESHPHESFKIYDGIEDSFVLSDMEIYREIPFNELPETAKIFFWERFDEDAFHKYVADKKGENYDSTYPYAWSGDCKKGSLVKKIKKYDMKLSN